MPWLAKHAGMVIGLGLAAAGGLIWTLIDTQQAQINELVAQAEPPAEVNEDVPSQ